MLSGGASQSIKNVGAQLKFARHHYENLQAIIRQIDTKAGVFITLLVFLATTSLPLAKDLVTKLHWSGKGSVTSWAFLISCGVQVLGLLVTALSVYRVIKPRGSQTASLSAGLMFSEEILGHSDSESYHSAIETATQEALLKNMTAEMFQLSLIIKKKTDALSLARWPTLISFAAWGVSSALSLYIATWR